MKSASNLTHAELSALSNEGLRAYINGLREQRAALKASGELVTADGRTFPVGQYIQRLFSADDSPEY